MTGSAFVRLDHVAASVHDLTEAITWWCDNFGFVHEVDYAIAAARARCALLRHGTTRLELFEVSPANGQPPAGKTFEESMQGGGYFHIAVQVEDVEASLRVLADNGVPAVHALSSGNFGLYAFVADPSGNLVELVQTRDPRAPRTL